jgi:hypothetical protein
MLKYLPAPVTSITKRSQFGAASASLFVNKEAANSRMTFTLFDFLRHFPTRRSGWRNGVLHRLS